VIPEFQIVVDSREQRPFLFSGAVRRKLDAGDYSVVGLEDKVAVERKTLQDLFGTVGGGRARFERELLRLAEYEYAAIVIEADLHEIAAGPPPHSRMSPKSVIASLIAWSMRHDVHVWFASDRAHAQALTYRILERFWRDKKAAAGHPNG